MTDSKFTDIELVVTDLDGTLWETPDATPPENVAAVAELGRRGVPVLVATGRRLGSTRAPLTQLGLNLPAVVLNGGLGVDLATGTRFHRGGFSSQEAVRVLDAFDRLDLQPCVYVDSDEPSVRVASAPSTHPGHLASFGSDVEVADLVSVVQTETVLSFSLLGTEQVVADTLHEALLAVSVPHNAPDRQYGGHSITVAPSNVSKWDGIVSFCAAHGLNQHRVLVIGDGPNDVEMLEAAAIAVVPADGHPDALSKADHVVASAADGGWVELLDMV